MTVAISAVLTVLFMMAAPRAVEAACAWVLWSKEVVSNSTRWSIERAVGTEAECKAEGHKALVFWGRHEPIAHLDADDLSVSLTAKSASISIYYRCLPDTIDPRAPKGGGR
jgi:hypothetical protein